MSTASSSSYIYDDDDDGLYGAEEDVEIVGSDDERISRGAVEEAAPPSAKRVKLTPPLARRTAPYASIISGDLQRSMDKEVDEITELTALPRDDVILLMHALKWRRQLAEERWFADGSRVRHDIGLSDGPDPPPFPASLLAQASADAGGAGNSSTSAATPLVTCPVLLVDVPLTSMDAPPCGHFCSAEAWGGHLSHALATDPNAAQLTRCLEMGCKELCRPRMFRAYLTAEQQERWKEFCLRRYAAENPRYRWCPAPGCQYVVFDVALQSANDVVTCAAGHAFCFRCGREPHGPASCEDMRRWVAKYAEDGLNLAWIKQNARPCPQCHMSIERVSGCNKVVCTGCRFAFCWVCGGDYAKTHDYPREAWGCNKPVQAVDTEGQAAAANDLQTYSFFSDRVRSSNLSADIAEKSADSIKAYVEALLEELNADYASGGAGAGAGSSMMSGGNADLDVSFISRALTTVAAARRICANTFIHAYFLHSNKRELDLVLDLQGQLEGTVEKLQSHLETEGLTVLALGSSSAATTTAPASGGAAPAKAAPGAGGGGAAAAAAVAAAGLSPLEQLVMQMTTKRRASSHGSGVGMTTDATGGSGGSGSLRERFSAYKMRVLTLSRATEDFIKNLVNAIEGGVLLSHDFPGLDAGAGGAGSSGATAAETSACSSAVLPSSAALLAGI